MWESTPAVSSCGDGRLYHSLPQIAQVKSVTGTEYSIAIAAYIQKEDRAIKIGIRHVGPDDSCPADPEEYVDSDETSLAVRDARLEGDLNETVVIDKMTRDTTWIYEIPPVACYRKSGKTRGGKDIWDSFCVATIKPVQITSTEPSRPSLLVFETNKIEIVDGAQVISADGIQKAIEISYHLRRPNLTGDTSNIPRLTEREFHIPPKIVRLPFSDGTVRTLCVACGFLCGTRDIYLAVDDVFGDGYVSGDPEDFYGHDIEGLSVIFAKYDGDDAERIIIEGEKWVIDDAPAVIFVRTVPIPKTLLNGMRFA